MYIPRAYDTYVYIQTEKARHLYDTEEMVSGMLEKDYISDEEILRNRGDSTSIIDGSSETQKNFKKAMKRKR